MRNTTDKKEAFTPEHGFKMMEKWNPVLRWLLVLPIAFISFVFVNGFANWAVKLSNAYWFLYSASFVFHWLASAIFIYYGAATAPKARKIVMIILSSILFFASVIVFFLPQEQYVNRDLSLTLKIINIVSTVLGIGLAFWWGKQER
ncbi:hypothetical protein [Chryseobacterium terrae]|uniref:Uncharacterized protein n=1 Tax=Chryseobacterium terrae TaxID=3163299 RepID=A0ABW8Y8L3_9FLAO